MAHGLAPSLWEEESILKKEICELLAEKVKHEIQCRDDEKRQQLEKELEESRALVENAKRSKVMLTEYYEKRNKERASSGIVASEEMFKKMKEEYFEMVVTAGKLDEKQRELRHEVRAANSANAKLQMELADETGGRYGKACNPWQVGVPYGSKAGRSNYGQRDKFGRPVRDSSQRRY